MIQRLLLRGCYLLLALCFVQPASAMPTELLIRKGDSAYVRKQYDSAIHYYGQAAGRVDPDAVVFYKLGNAHYRLQHTGEAVLAYERALKHRPGFADAAENLELIQKRINPAASREDVFFIRWWEALTRPSLSNVWAVLGIIFFCIPLGVLIWSRFRRSWPVWLWPHVIIGGIVLSLLFAVLSAFSVPSSPRNTGVVMRQDAPFRLVTGSGSAQAVANLPEGLIVQVVRSEGSALRVTLEDGREGLMQAADIALVE